MKSHSPLLKLAALAALSLFTFAPAARAQDPKPAPAPPGGGGPGPVSKKERDSDGPFRPKQVDVEAVITSKPEPGVTAKAIENDAYGFVSLLAVLASNGKVTDIRVLGNGLRYGLTGKAVDAAKKIRFTPARRYGHPVSQYVVLTYNVCVRDEHADKRVEILEQPRPAYTEEARRDGVAGRVVRDAYFLRDGTVEPRRVLEGLPGGLSEKAAAAAARIRFRPAELKGRKVTVARRVEYVFPPDAAAPAKP
jgi:hypothetical protein